MRLNDQDTYAWGTVLDPVIKATPGSGVYVNHSRLKN
jgi:hypothetical protein